jgi:hypothetical protein
MPRSFSFGLIVFKLFGRTRHIAHLLNRYTVLYHRMYAKPITVYDLQVEDVPEFYANGILVHNCPICAPLNGKVIAINEAFDGMYDSPPSHPRCRCWLTPVIEVPDDNQN